ncbi:MAG TPA: methylated-DNA--[protein]-cysteine S-methyltransferase [Hydrogenobaculum sp.]|nr:methylated-DNA--[protein]-cysteine S-methyltransferase [Hydrogenobaculum sp.]
MFLYRYKNITLYIYLKKDKIFYIKPYISDEKDYIPKDLKDIFDEYFLNKKDIERFDMFYMPERYQDIYKYLKENVRFGQVISYKELGDRLNLHQRTIATAMKSNPLPIFIPCHRVVFNGFYKDKNHIGGYNAGVDVKAFLLRHESVL